MPRGKFVAAARPERIRGRVGPTLIASVALRVPGKTAEGYDSYAGASVSNRIAIVLRYVPEQVDPKLDAAFLGELKPRLEGWFSAADGQGKPKAKGTG